MQRPLRSTFLLLVASCLLAPLLSGCEGGGEGTVRGTLFLRGCPDQEGGDPTGMPTVPPFDLAPEHFIAETFAPMPKDLPPRDVSRLVLHLQRTSHRYEKTDALTLYLTDVEGLRGRLGEPLPVVAPALSGATVPLPGSNTQVVRAALSLWGSCPMALVEPALSGAITMRELGFEPGEWVDGSFSFAIDDPRGTREGRAPADRDAAGQIDGAFRFQIRRGRSISSP